MTAAITPIVTVSPSGETTYAIASKIARAAQVVMYQNASALMKPHARRNGKRTTFQKVAIGAPYTGSTRHYADARQASNQGLYDPHCKDGKQSAERDHAESKQPNPAIRTLFGSLPIKGRTLDLCEMRMNVCHR